MSALGGHLTYENDQSNTDENSGVSSEPTSTEQTNESTSQESGSEQTTKDNVPFHEHPRFRELIEQKNQAADQYKTLESRYQQIEERLRQMSQPKAEQKEDELISELKKIRPEFGERFEKMWNAMSRLDQLEQGHKQTTEQTTRERAISTINSLHTEHKVSKEMQEIYNDAIESAARRNPKLGLDDLPGIYKSVHDKYSKLFDSARRTDRESYVNDKKKDANAPASQSRGKPIMQNVRKEFSADSGEARKQTVDEVLKLIRADKDN